MYNGSSTIQLTDNSFDDVSPQISGNYVVWSDYERLIFFSITLPIWSEVSSTLPADINDLVLTGTNNINGFGNELDNSLTGNDGNNWLFGKAGNDIILGGKGSDRLVGALGADTLTGGEGADFFIRKYSGGGIDTITDFNIADDILMLSASGFGAGLVAGAAITPDQFTIGMRAIA